MEQQLIEIQKTISKIKELNKIQKEEIQKLILIEDNNYDDKLLNINKEILENKLEIEKLERKNKILNSDKRFTIDIINSINRKIINKKTLDNLIKYLDM